jgi:NitT/TauT family transport system substrate-binding protein
MQNRKLFFKIFILLTLLISILYSCTPTSNNTIRIGVLDGPSAVSFIKMIDETTFIDGKKVEIIIKSEPLQIQALMMRDELDFAVLPTVMAANLYNKKLEYKLLACPIWGTLYLMGNDPEINIDTLNNRNISVFGQATTSDILTRRMILLNNFENIKIDYTYSTNNEIAQALLYKKIKLAVVSEPMVSNLLLQDASIKIIKKIECEEYINNVNRDIFAQTAFLVSSRFSADNHENVTAVCEAYSNSCNFTNEQPEMAAKLLVKHKLSNTTEAAKMSLPLCNINYVGAFAIKQELMEYLNIFYQFSPESIGGKLPDDNFIYQIY